MPNTKPSPDAMDILAAQVSTLWFVLRAFAATHPDLPGLIAELKKAPHSRVEGDVALPLADVALQISQAQLQEMISLLEIEHKTRPT